MLYSNICIYIEPYTYENIDFRKLQQNAWKNLVSFFGISWALNEKENFIYIILRLLKKKKNFIMHSKKKRISLCTQRKISSVSLLGTRRKRKGQCSVQEEGI
jgi:hypothetical protein